MTENWLGNESCARKDVDRPLGSSHTFPRSETFGWTYYDAMPLVFRTALRGLVAATPLWAAACVADRDVIGVAGGVLALRIENPAGHRLRLSTVPPPGGTTESPSLDLGTSAAWQGEVRSGRYRLDVSDAAGRATALPIPALGGLVPKSGLAIDVPSRLADAESGWAWIPPGLALRGDVLGVGQDDERPAHLVQSPSYFIAVDETSNADYVAFLNDVGPVEAGWIDLASLKCRIKRDAAAGPFTTDAPKLPVVTVSYAGAEAFAAWRTRRDPARRVHRLPTEAEWEKAARGPDTATFDYGDVYRRGAANQESGTLREAGAFGPHGFGCRDLTGNAFEWTADAYDATAYFACEGRIVDASVLPPRGAAAPSPYRTLRGGSFVLDGMYLRNSFRMRQRAAVLSDDIGFRLVREDALERTMR